MKILAFLVDCVFIVFITGVLAAGVTILIKSDDLAYAAKVRTRLVKPYRPDSYYCTKEGQIEAKRNGFCASLMDTEYVTDDLKYAGQRFIRKECVLHFGNDCR